MDFKSFSLMINETKVASFADYLAQGKIMATRCKKCNREYYPPQCDCSQCLSQEMDWFECPTEGRLVSFTQIMVLPEHFALPELSIPFAKAALTPSPVGLLEVKEGIRIMGWIPKTSTNHLKIGDRVKASPQMLDDGSVTIILDKIG
ncbi:MAG: hypothetical protein B1H11_05565 [Desulfobacteraceae bacterium 4484_190.1]|nr:MAG: hypothetical protein B1H11_05565 [Desulfobacteraceae bacterium 4484_190.1]